MEWELVIIRGLQKLSCGFFDALNLGLTMMGDELFFIVVAVLLFWCVDKKFAFKFINVYIFSVAVNEGIKAAVGRKRPYDVAGVRSIGEKTSGASFPSGHTQSISNIGTQINMKWHEGVLKKIFIPLAVGLTVIVAFTRMYLGQHYLTDVIVGAGLGVALAVLIGFAFDLLKDKEEWLIVLAPLCLIAAVVLTVSGAEGIENVMTVLGGYTAVTAGYFIEKKFIRYNVKSDRWWKQLIKIVVGLATVLVLKECLKFAFPSEQYILYNYLRYFIVGIWGVAGCPLLFKLARL